jgi:hypothetical protein
MATQEHAEKGERIHRAPLVKNVLPTSGIVISGGKRICSAPSVHKGDKAAHRASTKDAAAPRSSQEPKRS